jgi:aspartyl/asparaginyl beta-hydroxylase (cupin superfamily)
VWQDEIPKCIAETAVWYPRNTAEDDTNAQFIAEAREALPYWLERVRKLEAQVLELKQELEIYRNLYKKDMQDASNKIQRLEAVAEAAKAALSLLHCEKEFPEDLCIRVGNVVRYERVVQGLEQALTGLGGGTGDE